MIHYNARPRSFQLLNIIKYFEHYWFSFSHFNSILLSHISTVHHHPGDSCLSCLIRAQSFILSLEWFMAHYFKRQANKTNQFRDFLQPATIKHESLVTRKPAALWKTEKPVKLWSQLDCRVAWCTHILRLIPMAGRDFSLTRLTTSNIFLLRTTLQSFIHKH